MARLALPLSLFAASLAFAARAAAQPDETCPDNLLLNPGFESGFGVDRRLESVTARSWSPWHADSGIAGGLPAAPAFLPQRRGRESLLAARSGLWSQAVQSEGGTAAAGLWQRVAIPPGSQVLASAWAFGRSGQSQDPDRSLVPGLLALSIGLDPGGGGDPQAPGIAWTAPITITEAWVPLQIELPVAGAAVTLFLRGQPLQDLPGSASRWDAACLRVLGGIGTPTAEPSPRPRPSPSPSPPPPGAPSATPGLATVEALAQSLLAATERAGSLAATAEVRSAGSAASVQLGLPEEPAPAPAASAPAEAELPPEEPAAWALLVDHAGLAALALAAFLGGWILASGRA